MSAQDDKNAIGSMGRQEILTGLIFIVFTGFIVIVAIILGMVLNNPETLSKITISGSIDIGKFVDQFQGMIPAFLALLGVGVGAAVRGTLKK